MNLEGKHYHLYHFSAERHLLHSQGSCVYMCVRTHRRHACTSMINAAINTLVHGPLGGDFHFSGIDSLEWGC